MNRFTVYLIDDEEVIRDGIRFGLSDQFSISCFANVHDGLEKIKQEIPDVVLLDVNLPDMNGIDALRIIHDAHPHLPVIMITAQEEIQVVIDAMRGGAANFIIKPIDLDLLNSAIHKVLEPARLRKEIEAMQEKSLRDNMPGFISESNVIQDVMYVVSKLAASPDTPILIIGESGSGKEMIAKSIHLKSPNSKGPYIALNCAALPNQLLESELFGYEKGAFSGAKETGKIGLIEAAEGGSLFLDELGEMSMDNQAKLLRFLESGEFYRVGATKAKKVKTRIISATNRDLQKAIADGLFRMDLYYRIAVAKVEIPSLKERKDDILPIAKYFLLQSATKLNKEFTSISAEATQYLLEHEWVGNIRELRNFIERGVLLSDGPVFEISLIDKPSQRNTAKIAAPVDSPISVSVATQINTTASPILENGFPPLPPNGIQFEDMEKHYLREALRVSAGNEKKAAALLGMTYYAFRYRRKRMEDGDSNE